MKRSSARSMFFLTLALGLVIAPPTGAAKRPPKNPPPKTENADPRWAAFDKLVQDGKPSEAAAEARRMREAAIAAKDDALWQRTLVEEVRLRDRQGESGEALRLLREETWPAGKAASFELGLLWAQTLQTYLHRYRWEIRNREKIESKTRLPIEKMTGEQLFQELADVLQKLWTERASWGVESNEKVPAFVKRNDYPEGVRSTLRDTMTYLAVGALADTTFWSAAESNETTQLSVERLLEGIGPEMPGLADPTVHPLVRVTVALRDLESWHRGAGRFDAALEAKLERYRRVRASVAESDRATVTDALEKRLGAFKKAEWWAAGMADLATFRREEGRLREAHRIASEGQEEYPETPGGNRSLQVMKLLEAPEFRIESMLVDGAKRRSLLVHRRNLTKLYFRAYALPAKFLEERSGRWQIFPASEVVPSLAKKKPDAAWEVDFSEARDFGEHQTYVVPPMETPGVYVVLASMNANPDVAPNVTMGTVFQVSEVVLARETAPTGVTFTVFQGATGEPVAGAKVEVFEFNWNGKPFRRVSKLETDADGRVTYPATGSRDSLFALAEVKDEKGGVRTVIDPEMFSAWARSKESTRDAGFFYTDRAIYRPKQTIQWKLVLVRTKSGSSELAAAEQRSVKVELRDGNGEVVTSLPVKTDAYGTASGKFSIPSGKLLGGWSLRTAEGNAYANVRVEEYKRPTFEVTLSGAKEAVRLNKPASLEGEARYYFGMAVPEGQVKWRVIRQPVMPPWWGWCGWGHRHGAGRGTFESQTIAAGITKVDEQGKFRVQFLPKADERSALGDDASYRFSVAVDVTDPGGETRSASREYRLGAVSVTATIEPSSPYFVDGGSGTITFRRANLDGEPRKGKGLWRVVALPAPSGGAVLPADEKPTKRTDLPRIPKVNREDNVDGDEAFPRWAKYDGWQTSLANLADGSEVFRGAVEHGEDGMANVPLPKLQPGAYRIRYDGEDDFGKKVKAWRDLLVLSSTGAGAGVVPVPAILELDRSIAEPGDKVKVLAATGFVGHPMFFEILRDGVIVKRERIVGGDTPTREILVTEADRGGFSVALTLLRDYQLVRLTRDVAVPWTDRVLGVAFESFRDKMRPGSKEAWTLRVKAPSVGGKDTVLAAAQVLAFMYDRSLDAFGPHAMPSPLSLLPSRTGVPGLDASLGVGAAWHHRHDDVFPIPAYPNFNPDRFEENYYYGSYDAEYRRAAPSMATAGAPAKAKAASNKAEAEGMEIADEPRDQMKEKTSVQAAGKSLQQLARVPQPESAPDANATKPVEVRSNFSETAFWFPQLLSGPDGSVKLQFTVPDSVTSWRVLTHALTKDVKYGTAENTSKTVKELMVRPYLPRFVREGDSLALRVVVNNAGDKRLDGKVRLEILDGDTQKSLAKDFDLDTDPKSFSVLPGKTTDVRYPLKAPSRPGPVAVRVIAEAGDLSDGELRPMPILPSRLHLVQSRFATLRDGEKRRLVFEELAKDDDRTRVDEQMVLSVDGQLFNGVLKALPYLAKYAYECIEQTVNRFLSTSLVSATIEKHPAIARAAKAMAKRATPYVPWDQLDPNRKLMLEETPWLETSRGGNNESAEWSNLLDVSNVRRERESALEKLAKAQKPDGGFPWFSGGPGSTWVTIYVLNGFARAVESGVPVPKNMVQRAWKFTADQLRRDYFPYWRKDSKYPNELAAFVAFVATAFPDPTWTEGGLTAAEVKELVDVVFANWQRAPKYVKAYLAWTLKRQDRLADGRLVLESILDSAKTEKDRGTFWAPEDRAWVWYNDTVESHAFILRTTLEIEPRHPKIDGMALWLFLNRKLNHWKSTRATAEAIYALLKFVTADRTLGEAEKYVIESGEFRREITFAPDATETTARFVVPGAKIDPRKSSTVTFESKSRAFALASATWHFSTERLPRESASDFFSVSRSYFVRETTPKGPVLKPLAEGANVRVGDEVEVQLLLKTKHPAEFVHLRDPRGAGFEPEGAVSGYRWGLATGWYEEFRDSATNFFFEQLPAGEYPFRYRLRATTNGKFRVGPAVVQSMYAPEFTAYSSGTGITIRD